MEDDFDEMDTVEMNDSNAVDDWNMRLPSFEEICACFELPIKEAAKTLQICVTKLKKHCRDIGIERWPMRKIRSLEKKKQELQDAINKTSFHHRPKMHEKIIKLQQEIDILKTHPDKRDQLRVKFATENNENKDNFPLQALLATHSKLLERPANFAQQQSLLDEDDSNEASLETGINMPYRPPVVGGEDIKNKNSAYQNMKFQHRNIIDKDEVMMKLIELNKQPKMQSVGQLKAINQTPQGPVFHPIHTTLNPSPISIQTTTIPITKTANTPTVNTNFQNGVIKLQYNNHVAPQQVQAKGPTSYPSFQSTVSVEKKPRLPSLQQIGITHNNARSLCSPDDIHMDSPSSLPSMFSPINSSAFQVVNKSSVNPVQEYAQQHQQQQQQQANNSFSLPSFASTFGSFASDEDDSVKLARLNINSIHSISRTDSTLQFSPLNFHLARENKNNTGVLPSPFRHSDATSASNLPRPSFFDLERKNSFSKEEERTLKKFKFDDNSPTTTTIAPLKNSKGLSSKIGGGFQLFKPKSILTS